MKVREVIRVLEADGWRMQQRKGTNHRKFRHPTKPGVVVVSGNPGHDIATGTLHAILKQAGLK